MIWDLCTSHLGTLENFQLHLFLPECQMIRNGHSTSRGGLHAILTSLMFLTQCSVPDYIQTDIALFLRECKEKRSSLNVMGCCWFSSSECSDPLGTSLLHQTRRGLITKLLCMFYSCQSPWKLDVCSGTWDGRRHCGKLCV